MIRRPIGVSPNPRNPTDVPRPPSESVAFLMIISAVVLGFYLYYAQYSGSIRWVLGVAGIAVFAGFAWSMIVRRTSEPPPLIGPRSREVPQEGDLGFLAAAVKRASHGLPYSQVQVVSRARAVFAERAALALGLSSEAMAAAQRDPAELHRILDDRVLERYLHIEDGDLEDRSQWVREARTRNRFATEFQDIVARMEAWR